MNEIQKQIEKEKKLFEYQGEDRVVLASEKSEAIKEEQKNRAPFKVTMGIKELDECADGFRLGQLIVVSGPPKQGKSQLCAYFSKRFTEQEQHCIYFSYELGYEELFEKYPSEKLDFYVPNYITSGNLAWVEDRIIEAKLKHDVRIVFIDHLDFLRDPEILKGISYNLSSYVGSIVQKIKSIAVQHRVLIFLMSHIRKNKWTTNDLPSSEELRDTGQTAQLADMVMMIIRKRAETGNEIYQGNKVLIGIMENRHNGKTKKISAEFRNGEYFPEFFANEEPDHKPLVQDNWEIDYGNL